jgi:hypothetical protein
MALFNFGSYVVSFHEDGSIEQRYVSEEEMYEPVKAGPQVPPECWNSRPVDADRCMSAIREMCRAV